MTSKMPPSGVRGHIFPVNIYLRRALLIQKTYNNMSVKVAINGFGRIGRLVFRQIHNMEGIDVVAINDLTSPAVLAHLLKYDSAQGRFEEDVKSTENAIIVNGNEIKIYAQ